MSYIGKQAAVVGAGIAGLTAARALADYFEDVLVFDGDALPPEASARKGVPQGRHAHVLLAGGQRALASLFPNFDQDLARTGAVPVRISQDIRLERPGYDPYPARDFGFDCFAQTRPQLEHAVRERLRSIKNVRLFEQCRVQKLTPGETGRAVKGLVYASIDGKTMTVDADLVVDASGRGALTLGLLEEAGCAPPATTVIGVDISYASAVYDMLSDAPRDWKAVFTLPQPPESSRAGLLLPIEGGRWILSLAGRRGDEPPGDPDGFMAYVRGLRTPTIYNAIQGARRVGEIVRFGFTESIYRHYDRIANFPRGLLPMGDALCRFNPIYGQGMSVAAQEAQALQGALSARSGESDPLHRLAAAFFAKAGGVIETPWVTAVLPDLIYPDARGERPPDFEEQIRTGMAMIQLAAGDPDLHKLMTEVAHLLKPHSAYRDPQVASRLQQMMAKAGRGSV